MILVIRGSKIDLVHIPKENLSKKHLALSTSVTLVVVPISILAAYLFLGLGQWQAMLVVGMFSLVMSVVFSLLEERASEDVFFSKRKKHIMCWLFVLCNWLFAILSTSAWIFIALI